MYIMIVSVENDYRNLTSSKFVISFELLLLHSPTRLCYRILAFNFVCGRFENSKNNIFYTLKRLVSESNVC